MLSFPHCDARILHESGTCNSCDRFPEWQELRKAWGIAFTGIPPTTRDFSKELPCPADYNRPTTAANSYRHWFGNAAREPAVDGLKLYLDLLEKINAA